MANRFTQVHCENVHQNGDGEVVVTAFKINLITASLKDNLVGQRCLFIAYSATDTAMGFYGF